MENPWFAPPGAVPRSTPATPTVTEFKLVLSVTSMPEKLVKTAVSTTTLLLLTVKPIPVPVLLALPAVLMVIRFPLMLVLKSVMVSPFNWMTTSLLPFTEMVAGVILSSSPRSSSLRLMALLVLLLFLPNNLLNIPAMVSPSTVKQMINCNQEPKLKISRNQHFQISLPETTDYPNDSNFLFNTFYRTIKQSYLKLNSSYLPHSIYLFVLSLQFFNYGSSDQIPMPQPSRFVRNKVGNKGGQKHLVTQVRWFPCTPLRKTCHMLNGI